MAKRVYNRSGTVRWYDDEGLLHRVDGPASVWPHGTQYWFCHGRFHFVHGPALVWTNGCLRWYGGDHLLRERGPYG